MPTHRAHKIRLYPNKTQEEYLRKSIAVSRKAWNLCLAEWDRIYQLHTEDDTNPRPDPNAISRWMTQECKSKEELHWFNEVDATVKFDALRDLKTAFGNFWKNPGHFGRPKFKSYRDPRKTFGTQNVAQLFTESGKPRLRLPKLTPIKMAEKIRFDGRILGGTISIDPCGHWHCSFLLEVEESTVSRPEPPGEIVGMDFGLKEHVFSDGQRFKNPKFTYMYAKKLARLQRRLSKMKGNKRGEKKSNNYKKQSLRVNKIHAKIANSRKDFIRNMCNVVYRRYKYVAMEDLVVKVGKKSRFAKSYRDAAFGEIKATMTQKTACVGGDVILINRYEPTTQICSQCGFRNLELRGHKGLKIREWICPECGIVHDRDLNAAQNILRIGKQILDDPKVEVPKAKAKRRSKKDK